MRKKLEITDKPFYKNKVTWLLLLLFLFGAYFYKNKNFVKTRKVQRLANDTQQKIQQQPVIINQNVSKEEGEEILRMMASQKERVRPGKEFVEVSDQPTRTRVVLKPKIEDHNFVLALDKNIPAKEVLESEFVETLPIQDPEDNAMQLPVVQMHKAQRPEKTEETKLESTQAKALQKIAQEVTQEQTLNVTSHEADQYMKHYNAIHHEGQSQVTRTQKNQGPTYADIDQQMKHYNAIHHEGQSQVARTQKNQGPTYADIDQQMKQHNAIHHGEPLPTLDFDLVLEELPIIDFKLVVEQIPESIESVEESPMLTYREIDILMKQYNAIVHKGMGGEIEYPVVEEDDYIPLVLNPNYRPKTDIARKISSLPKQKVWSPEVPTQEEETSKPEPIVVKPQQKAVEGAAVWSPARKTWVYKKKQAKPHPLELALETNIPSRQVLDSNIIEELPVEGEEQQIVFYGPDEKPDPTIMDKVFVYLKEKLGRGVVTSGGHLMNEKPSYEDEVITKPKPSRTIASEPRYFKGFRWPAFVERPDSSEDDKLSDITMFLVWPRIQFEVGTQAALNNFRSEIDDSNLYNSQLRHNQGYSVDLDWAISDRLVAEMYYHEMNGKVKNPNGVIYSVLNTNFQTRQLGLGARYRFYETPSLGVGYYVGLGLERADDFRFAYDSFISGNIVNRPHTSDLVRGSVGVEFRSYYRLLGSLEFSYFSPLAMNSTGQNTNELNVSYSNLMLFQLDARVAYRFIENMYLGLGGRYRFQQYNIRTDEQSIGPVMGGGTVNGSNTSIRVFLGIEK